MSWLTCAVHGFLLTVPGLPQTAGTGTFAFAGLPGVASLSLSCYFGNRKKEGSFLPHMHYLSLGTGTTFSSHLVSW